MAERVQCEFFLIRYVPDVVKGEFANIGVLLREAGRDESAWCALRGTGAGAMPGCRCRYRSAGGAGGGDRSAAACCGEGCSRT